MTLSRVTEKSRLKRNRESVALADRQHAEDMLRKSRAAGFSTVRDWMDKLEREFRLDRNFSQYK